MKTLAKYFSLAVGPQAR